jgi:hypothetical protein
VVPSAAHTQIPVPVTPPKVTATPVSVPTVRSIDGNKDATAGHKDLKEVKRHVQDEIIEPGIRNKEVESYRTHDAKEAEYKDTIIQDDMNASYSPK